MVSWILASLVSFSYLTLAACVRPGLPRRRRTSAVLSCLCGLVVCALAALTPVSVVLHGWVIPPALLLIFYWASGLLFVAPMPAAERALRGVDEALGVDAAVRGAPGWLREILEFAYVGVYALVPLALALLVATAGPQAAERFWSVVLVTDYVCFGCLPWIQTRPPRAFPETVTWRARLRPVNLHVLSAASVQVNTFPSGHAAEGLAVALLVSGAAWPVAVLTAVAGLLVSVGAVLGRYHYAADALVGWMVALAAWLLLG